MALSSTTVEEKVDPEEASGETEKEEEDADEPTLDDIIDTYARR